MTESQEGEAGEGGSGLLVKTELSQSLDFPGGSDSKVSACNAGHPGSIPL